MVETKRVTRFEMRDARHLVASAPVTGLALVTVAEPGGRDAAEIRRLHDLVAGPYRWSSLAWSDGRWCAFLGDPARRHRFVEHDGVRVGWACYRSHAADEVELESFGLVPGAIGRGLGGCALTLVVREIWATIGSADPRAGGPGLVWLTTTSWDHPHAAANYRARGFTGCQGPGGRRA